MAAPHTPCRCHRVTPSSLPPRTPALPVTPQRHALLLHRLRAAPAPTPLRTAWTPYLRAAFLQDIRTPYRGLLPATLLPAACACRAATPCLVLRVAALTPACGLDILRCAWRYLDHTTLKPNEPLVGCGGCVMAIHSLSVVDGLRPPVVFQFSHSRITARLCLLPAYPPQVTPFDEKNYRWGVT